MAFHNTIINLLGFENDLFKKDGGGQGEIKKKQKTKKKLICT